MTAVVRELGSRAAAAGGLILTGAALVAAQTQLAPPPRLDIAVHADRATARSTGAHSVGWSVDTVVRGQDSDVLMALRFDHLPADRPRLVVRLCPPGAAARPAGCTATLFDAPLTGASVALGRVGTLQPGVPERVRVELHAQGGFARNPTMSANVTPCAPPRSGDLWRRGATRPVRPDILPFAGSDACSLKEPPWLVLGGTLIAGGVLTPVIATLRRRA